ncbi:MAG: type II toxin-antitoxin system Phd/YefM family antitoxin [Desulfosalsimonadaceae bacterium]
MGSNRTKEQAVLISLEDYQAMEETAYLLSSPANRAHLEKSLKEAQHGKLIDFSAAVCRGGGKTRSMICSS